MVGTSWGPPVLTDHDGRFQFDDLAADRGGYAVKLDFRKDFQPVKAPLRSGVAPVEIRVERGSRLAGRVVEASTGRPIPGVKMYAMTHTPGVPASYRRFDPESLTDEDGRFRFSNLPDAQVELNDGDGLKWESPTSRRPAPTKPRRSPSARPFRVGASSSRRHHESDGRPKAARSELTAGCTMARAYLTTFSHAQDGDRDVFFSIRETPRSVPAL